MNPLEKLADGVLGRALGLLEKKTTWGVIAGFLLAMYFFASAEQAKYVFVKAWSVVLGVAGLGLLGFSVTSAREAFHGIDEAATARGEKPSRIGGFLYALMVFLVSAMMLAYAGAGLILN